MHEKNIQRACSGEPEFLPPHTSTSLASQASYPLLLIGTGAVLLSLPSKVNEQKKRQAPKLLKSSDVIRCRVRFQEPVLSWRQRDLQVPLEEDLSAQLEGIRSVGSLESKIKQS